MPKRPRLRRADCTVRCTGQMCWSRFPLPRRASVQLSSSPRGHQCQRHSDLLGRALSRSHGSLHSRPGAARCRGLPIDNAASVASFFVSRIDVSTEKRLQKVPTIPRGRSSTRLPANSSARLRLPTPNSPTRPFKEIFHGIRFAGLRQVKARVQRPLWPRPAPRIRSTAMSITSIR